MNQSRTHFDLSDAAMAHALEGEHLGDPSRSHRGRGQQRFLFDDDLEQDYARTQTDLDVMSPARTNWIEP